MANPTYDLLLCCHDYCSHDTYGVLPYAMILLLYSHVTVLFNWFSQLLPLCLHTAAAQFQSCHDSTGCGGNEVSGVSTARDCCLGSGLSFQIGGTCQECIGKQFL